MITSFEINKDEQTRQIQSPFIRISIGGIGCGEDGCHCSPPNYISISDGSKGLNVELTDEQVKELFEKRYLEVIY